MPASILVIEDDPDVRAIIDHSLVAEDYVVSHAADGVEGIERYRELQPDLVILDVMMPRLSGFELLRRLRESGELRRDCPVLVLTARVAEQDVTRGFELGASDYLTKPFMIAELRARVRALLQLSR